MKRSSRHSLGIPAECKEIPRECREFREDREQVSPPSADGAYGRNSPVADATGARLIFDVESPPKPGAEPFRNNARGNIGNAAGRKGVTFQRYKGLGEMNKDQLWETTLDREARTLLQVKIREVDEADDIFVKLMGDIIEPRREFIQENALSVANLDV